MNDDDPDDPITDALLGDSVYERIRFQRASLFKGPIPRKLRWQSGLLFALATVLPVLAAVPPGARALFPAGGPLAATTKVLLLGLIGGAVTFAAGVWLVAVALTRERIRDTMTEARAHSLLTLEEMASSIGLVTGGAAIVIAVAFHLLGLGGAEAVTAYIELTGRNPFAGVGLDIPASGVAGAAAIGGVLLFSASQFLSARNH